MRRLAQDLFRPLSLESKSWYLLHEDIEPRALRIKTMIEYLPFLFVVIVLLVLYLLSTVRVLSEYERGVVFRLGHLQPEARGPGLVLLFWPIDRMNRVSLRTVTMDVPPQDVITRDNVTVSVNAVVYFRVIDPRLAVVEVENYLYATAQLAQTTLRSVLGEADLDDLLAEREKLNQRLQDILDKQTDRWGIKVSLVEIKAVDLPQEMRRAMSKQAEAEREKRAKIIHAEGEYQSAEKLVSAAHAIAAEPIALQLRYLQTLTDIGVEQNTTVVFPVPLQLFEGLVGQKNMEKFELPLSRPLAPVRQP